MSNSNLQISVTEKYTHSSKEEWDSFIGDITAKMRLSNDRLDKVMKEGVMHPAVVRKVVNQCKAEQSDMSASDIDLRKQEYLLDLDEKVYATLYVNIDNKTLKGRLNDDFDGRGYHAYQHIQSKWAVAGNTTRVTIAMTERKDLVEEGVSALSLGGVETFVDKYSKLNNELKGSCHHHNNILVTTTVLDSLAYHSTGFVRDFKTANDALISALGEGVHDKRWADVWDKLKAQLEEHDRVEAMVAARVQREALRAKTVAQESEIKTLHARIAKLEKEQQAGGDIKPRNALYVNNHPACTKCGRKHPPEVCIGEALHLGTMTLEAAAERLPKVLSPDARKTLAEKYLREYRDKIGEKPSAPPQSAIPAGQPPPRKLACAVRVLSVGGTRGPRRTKPALTDGDAVKVGMDSKCDQHMFNDRAFFPNGVVAEPHTEVRVADGGLIPVGGKGTAEVVEPISGQTIYFENALLVEDLDECLASVEQMWSQSKVLVRFGDDKDILFPNGGDPISVPIDDSYNLCGVMRIPAAVEASAMTTITEQPPDVVTRGKTSGGPAARLPIKDVCRLWGARLNLPASRLRALPGMVSDAPDLLRKASDSDFIDESRLHANAPRIHPAPVERTSATRPGMVTVLDLNGPHPPSRVAGNRYAAGLLDMCTNEGDVHFMVRKSEFPARLEQYFVRNEGRDGCTFKGGTLYTDNEIVLNSQAVLRVCNRFGVTMRNSCEYEPWQNGVMERFWRTVEDWMRIAHARGFDDPAAAAPYWTFSMAQAAEVHARTGHSWQTHDDGITPRERRTGRTPTGGDVRPMFCLAFVRRPPALRDGPKTHPQADKAMHLGFARTKPGYVFEVLEGPRKGKIIYSSQAVFREGKFPFNPETSVADPAAPVTDAEMTWLEQGDPATDLPQPAAAGDTPLGTPGGNGVIGADADDSLSQADLAESGDSDAESTTFAPQVQGPRRSTRGDGVLSQEIFQYQRFKGALSVHMYSTDTTEDPSVAHFAYSSCVGKSVTDAPEPLMQSSYVPKTFSDINTINDAKQRQEWLESYYKEHDDLFFAESLRAVPTRPGDRLLPSKPVFNLKPSALHGKKVRRVLGGHRMRYGQDYYETYSPCPDFTTLRAFVATAKIDGETVKRGDDRQAYLQAPSTAERLGIDPNRIKMVEGYESIIDGIEYCCETGNLYGGPDAGRNLYVEKVEWFKSMGFVQCDWSPCLFRYTRKSDGATIDVLVYVDDTLRKTKCDDLDEWFCKIYSERWDWTDYGEDLGNFIGLGLTQTDSSITIDLISYIEDLANEVFPGGVPITPEVPSTALLAKLVEEASRAKVVPTDVRMHKRFQSVTSSLLFGATTALPHIMWVVNMLTRCMAYPTKELLGAAERVVAHIYHRRHQYVLRYVSDPRLTCDFAPDKLEGASDSSFEQERSTSGYIFFWGLAAIAWCTRKQKSIALSSFEGEIMAASLASCDAVFIRGVLAFLGHAQDKPTVINIDSSSAVAVAKDPAHHAKSKHILRRDLYIRELCDAGIIEPKLIKTDKNPADIFTKHVDRVPFQKHCATIYNIA